MGTLNAFYVSVSNADIIAALLSDYPAAFTESSFEFYAVERSEDDVPESELLNLSERFNNDVVWLSFQSVVDAFKYYHWQSGTQRRVLIYGCYGPEERTWNRSDGEPEPWEREVIFDERKLASELRFADSESERLQLERTWRDAEIQPGRTVPPIDARNCAHKIASYYGFPGYGLSLA